MVDFSESDKIIKISGKMDKSDTTGLVEKPVVST